MNVADDFMDSFFAAYPQAKGCDLDIEEMNKLLGEYQGKINNNPIDDFDGLSPVQMNSLLYRAFLPECMLQFREDFNLHVDKAPFFKLSELLLNEIKRAGKLKLTVKGNLPASICKLLSDQNLIQWPYMAYNKTTREDAIPYLRPLKYYLLDEGIVKKRNNVLTFTKKGEKLMGEASAVRFRSIFKYLVSRFHWGNLYRLEDGGNAGQFGWAYSLVLLAKYGADTQLSKFYSLKLIQAFEKKLWNDYQNRYESREATDYHYAYEYRFFENFAHWFGLANIHRKKVNGSFFDQISITKSELFDNLFEVKNFT